MTELAVQTAAAVRPGAPSRAIAVEGLDAADMAVARRGINNNYAFRYFCGICWKKIKEANGEG